VSTIILAESLNQRILKNSVISLEKLESGGYIGLGQKMLLPDISIKLNVLLFNGHFVLMLRLNII
jgi:hypothetical protein